MAYLLDTNVLITAKNLYYGIDFCPGFWEWIEHMGSAGTVRSVSKVKDEITSGDDDLAAVTVRSIRFKIQHHLFTTDRQPPEPLTP